MINVATTMASARMERSVTEQQFLIPRPTETSWGYQCILDKENIIGKFVGYTPVMNQRKDEECMTTFLDSVIVNGVQNLGLTPFEEFLPRSAPLVDFLSIGLHSGAARMERSNLVSEETLTGKRNEARAEREKARGLLTEVAAKREEAGRLQREEERLGAQADDLDKEVVDMEWQEPMLERRIADIERTHAEYL